MGDNTRLKKGAWTSEEDERLSAYITTHGRCTWSKLPIYAGLNRCGKSCRLRWMNYLRPDLKRGSFTKEEEKLILNLLDKFGSSWSKIAAGLPGRSDNEIKNYWHTHLKEKSRKITRTKKAKSVPKPLRQDNVPFAILESSSETGVSLQKSQDSSPAVGNEVAIVKDPVDAIPWPELAELKIMLKAPSKPDPECEHMDDIRSVLDFPVSPQTSDGFSPRSIDDFIMENLVTDEILMFSAPSQKHDMNDQFKIDDAVVMVKKHVTDETVMSSELDWIYWKDGFMKEGVPIVESVDTNQMAIPSEPYLERDMNDQFKIEEEVVIVKNQVTDETAMSSELDWNFWNDEFIMEEGVPVVGSVDTNQMVIPSEPYLELDPDYWNEFSLLYQSLGFTF